MNKVGALTGLMKENLCNLLASTVNDATHVHIHARGMFKTFPHFSISAGTVKAGDVLIGSNYVVIVSEHRKANCRKVMSFVFEME